MIVLTHKTSTLVRGANSKHPKNRTIQRDSKTRETFTIVRGANPGMQNAPRIGQSSVETKHMPLKNAVRAKQTPQKWNLYTRSRNSARLHKKLIFRFLCFLW